MLWQKLGRNRKGVAAIEFALIIPVLMLIFLGVVEVSRLVQFHQKVDAASNQMVNIINQNLNLKMSSANAIMNSVTEMLKPYDSSQVGIFISAIQQDGATGTPSDVKWQIKRLPPKEIYKDLKSKIAPSGEGSKVTLNFIPLEQREQIIVVELFVEYKPIINSTFTRQVLGLSLTSELEYRYSVGRPRFGSFQIPPR